MKKITILITCILYAGIISAYDFEAVCESGQTLYYTITYSPGQVIVTYPHHIEFDEYYSGHTKPAGNLIIPSSVTYNDVTYSVTKIDENAFNCCYDLNSVVIPNSVTQIGERAFYGCIGLTSVTIPNSITRINDGTFYWCGLREIDLPNSIRSIGVGAFYCNITEVTIPSSVTSIGRGAFYQCYYLETVNFNATNCTSMGNAVWYYESLRTLNIGDNVTNIPSGAFRGCTGLTDVTIPNSVTSIGGYAFYDCTGLTEVTIPNSVTSIGDYAFYNCSGLTGTLIIPNSVTSIGASAFYGCSGLTSLKIGSGVTNIEGRAFLFCNNIGTIYSYAENPPVISQTTFYDYIYGTEGIATSIPVIVPCGCVDAYRNAQYWNRFTNIQQSSDCAWVKEKELTNMELYPNPANNTLHISTQELISEIEIVNTLGQVVMQMDVNDDNAVCDVKGLANGIYVVRIRTLRQAQGAEIQRKFIKE